MGNNYSGIIQSDLLNQRKIAGYNTGQIDFLREKFVLMCDDDLTMDLNTFAELLRMEKSKAQKIFNNFDLDSSNKIDSYEFICAISLLSHAPLTEKAAAIFRLYDFDNSCVLNFDEMVVLFRCCMCSLVALSGRKDIPSIQTVEEKVEKLLSKYDKNKDRHISLEEFKSIVTKDREILVYLTSYGLVRSYDKRSSFGDAEGDLPECDSDLENEEHKADELKGILAQGRENIKSGIDFLVERKIKDG